MVEDKQGIKWEYKGADGAIYGPHSTSDLISWTSQGYFRGESSVSIRKVTSKKETAQDLIDELVESDEEEKGDAWENSNDIDFSKFL